MASTTNSRLPIAKIDFFQFVYIFDKIVKIKMKKSVGRGNVLIIYLR